MYKLHLILKYLLKRRIAWVSLAAVMLCTTMVLVVISVMGGWLNMFKSSFRGLSGDIVIHSESLRGFPYYEKMIAAIEKDPACQVEAAVPSIETAGLFNTGNGPIFARVMGIPIEEMEKVNKFNESLFRQHTEIEDKLKDPKLPAEQRARLQRKLKQPPSFDFLDEVTTPLDALPPGLAYAKPVEGKEPPPGAIEMPEDYPQALKGQLRYDAQRHNLVFRGQMTPSIKEALVRLSSDPAYLKAIDALFAASQSGDLINYPRVTGKYYGLIAGIGVIGIHRGKDGKWMRYDDNREWDTPISLTVLDLSSGRPDASNTVTRKYFIVDDSHLGVWQYDNSYVYVPFGVLQRDLGMDAQKVQIEDKSVEKPARVSDIHIKIHGVDPNDERKLIDLKERIQGVVHNVVIDEERSQPVLAMFDAKEPIVQTWQDTQRIWISAVENEKMLTVMLFGIMCIVAIFLIFCIFYMIVVEKTKDIGIIKSVGATSSGVAGIFLGYGLVIGIIGGGMGLLLSYIIVHNINEMHTWLGHRFGVQIWNPEVYLFDKIPNEMSGKDIAWILPTAVLASVLGALIPSIRAARMNPVEALRWE